MGFEVGFIGAGNMALALAAAIRAREPDTMFRVHDIRPSRVDLFREKLGGVVGERSNRAVVRDCEITFLAVKPQDIDAVLRELGTEAAGIVVSIAAGVSLERLEAGLPRARVFRVMPNTPALVGMMAAGYAAGRRAGPEDARRVQELLSAAGTALAVPEELLDAVTGLSGSGPAFVARLIEAWVRAGQALGLAEEEARALTLKTFQGTAVLLAETGMSAQELVDLVSSPGGTTVAGREVLESSDVADVLRRAIEAAARRSKELGT